MRLVVLGLGLVAAACSGARLPSKVYAASEVGELASLPAGYVAGETISARCRRAPRAAAFDDEALDNVDCSFERLSRVLRGRAGSLSAPLIVGKRCRARDGERPRLECSASVARAGGSVGLGPDLDAATAPAPSPAQVLDLDDPRPQDAERIRVSFAPLAGARPPRLPPRAYDRVAETASPSVGRRALGQVSARCASSCADAELRFALRATAGHLGAGEVAAVKCFKDDGAARCVAIALMPWSS